MEKDKLDIAGFSGIELPVKMGIGSKSTIYKMTHRGEIPHYKIRGGKLLFHKDELIRWVQGHKILTRA